MPVFAFVGEKTALQLVRNFQLLLLVRRSGSAGGKVPLPDLTTLPFIL